ncbi:Isoamyl acetate-hydrolyzing esterase and related enzymes [Phaffia rhodozyma]|uniref:Protein BCP1 n=1 Tax=Phaffia rhodozyma TaxID=264483 RepID=A0A0F7SRN6_PHARH|nr:Isoamyl acetate-hydrolyzing esterase and related enzymes [Phaffia rhodozyma]
MAKRKSNANASTELSDDSGASSGNESDDSTPSLINVDFDFFAPSPDVDLIALKRLLRQLLYSDADLFDLHPVAELVLDSSKADGVGSCIKVDGEESDPYSIIAVLNLNLHKDSPTLKPLLQYFIKKSKSNSDLHSILSSIPSGSITSGPQVGLVVSERLLNMPVQTQAPMYRMLGEEMQQAVSQGKPYKFTHLLLLSKLYVAPSISSNPKGSKKKKKNGKSAASRDADDMDVDELAGLSQAGLLPFHPEDSFILRHALASVTYPFDNAANRKQDDPLEFGLDQRGGMMLFEASKLESMVKTMEECCI